MAYLVGEIFVSLLVAAILGGAIGWLLCRWSMAEKRFEAPRDPDKSGHGEPH